MPEIYFKYGLYALLSVFLVSVGGNAWSVYKMSQMDATIQAQLKGVLSKNAQKISAISTALGTVKSEMVSRKALEEKASEIIGGLDAKTQEAINRYTRETGAKVNAISKRFVHMETRLEAGITRIGNRVDRQKTPPPPKSWKGVSRLDQTRCKDHPERCEPFQFTWLSPFNFRGRPVYSFTSRNLWSGDGSGVDFNLAFKVVAINWGEDQSRLGSGAVENQGIHIYGGYFNEQGKFIALPGLESELMSGDPGYDPKLIYVPRKPASPTLSLKLFEPSLLVGSTYQEGEFGLSVGGSFVNFARGEYRLGANFSITESNQYLGLMATWHPYIMGKHLNIAPGAGWVYGTDGSNTWSLGLHFQVW